MLLDIKVRTGSAVPIYQQIIDQVKRAVAIEKLSPGDQLPSVRALSKKLTINPNTVTKAYGELVREGIAESRSGRGLFIIERVQFYSEEERLKRLETAIDEFVNKIALLDFEANDVWERLRVKLKEISQRKGRDE
ncbi:GntR family transcriptional regulator [Candidatus Uabimicrobium amorphum]|uniref:GntR family transcriptional regulator n=1 Tax=Uabimicrobium amorphum TaxID=2596890 RepID=A0A5S9ITK0_UABAM|nr:GntR family transcriptional regulator [Candidatus Uabimicrobium amorphum]BBM87172.1 GntR family transcriptional regulator [Candidatus Uabimicrobium amorphum]